LKQSQFFQFLFKVRRLALFIARLLSK